MVLRNVRKDLVGLALVLVLAACGGSSLSNAKSDFQKGRYADAKTMLVELEPQSRVWTAQERAEYALYRGLVHHALGDRPSALQWLREAKSLEAAAPRTLGNDDRTRLDLALESLAGAGDDASASP